jgi:hypothetical protein
MDMNFFRSTVGKTRMGCTRNKIFREEAGIQNLLTELREK